VEQDQQEILDLVLPRFQLLKVVTVDAEFKFLLQDHQHLHIQLELQDLVVELDGLLVVEEVPL
jgi:hypothetical protein